jgi:DNA-binding MarR family transcriptional regulator
VTTRVDLTDLEMAAWRGFLEAHRRVMDVLETELRQHEDLPLAWYDVLVQLSESPTRSLRMQGLADAVLLSKSGLTRLVDRMEAAGLVERAPCEDDGRGIMAVLTDRGYQRLRDAAPTHVAGVRAHFADLLRPGEANVLAQALGRIAASSEPPA